MHQMFKFTSCRSFERLFPDIKLYNRLSVLCVMGFFPSAFQLSRPSWI